jgi:gliding motility-associated-like protein
MNLFSVNKPLYAHSIFTIVGLLLLSIHCWSQQRLTIEWERTYGGNGFEEMAAALPTSDGGYIFGGITTTRVASFEVTTHTFDTVDFPEFTGDFWILKTDKDGDIEWDKRIGGFKQDRLWSIVQTSDGGYLVGGESRSGVGNDRTTPNRGENDYWVVKIDANGNKQWDRAYGSTGADELRKIVPLPNGQYCLAGFSNSPAGFEKSTSSVDGSDDYWVVRIDENGVPLNDFSVGSDSLDWLYDAILTTDGNLMLVGQSKSEPGFGKSAPLYGQNDMWLVKCSINGHILWDASFGGTGADVCQRIRQANDGNYFVIGESTSDKMSGNKTATHYGGTDAWVVKFSDNITGPVIIWDVAYGGISGDFGYDVVETDLGTLLLFGQSTSPPVANGKDAPLIGGNDYWCIFTNPQGGKLWEETLGGITEDIGRIGFLAHDYGYILAGASRSNTSLPYKSQDNRGPIWSDDLWVIRTGCAFPPPELNDLPKFCLDDVISLDATVPGPCDGCTYHWEDGTNSPLRSLSPDTTTEVKVTVVHPDGCEMADSILIVIVPGPDEFLGSWTPVSCYGKTDASLSIDSIGGIAPPFLYSINGSEFSVTTSFYTLGAGIYDIEVLDTNGCTLDTSLYILQPDSVMVDLGPDIFLELGDSVQLQALTNLVDSFRFFWGQPLELSCADCLEPFVQPFLTSTYSIEVKDKNGCEAMDNIVVIVKKEDNVYIPTAFSPNNLDNLNDFFTVYAGKSIEKVKSLHVFDRWGEMMFERFDFRPNIDQIGWDGKLNERPLDPGVFAYKAVIEYIDGRIEEFYGTVTLMN